MKMKSFLIILLVIILLAAYYKRMGHTKIFQFFLVDHDRHWRSLKLMKVNNPPSLGTAHKKRRSQIKFFHNRDIYETDIN